MTLPYSTATSGEKALGEMQKILRGFGCSKFGSMVDDGEGTILVQFEHRGRQVTVKASMKGYAAAWLKENTPKVHKGSTTQQFQREKKALDIASVAVYSVLRDWIKGQITAIETGVLSFEGAFLGQLMLSNGKTALEQVQASKMLPAPKGEGA